jgi:hypothetical protein
MLLKLNPYRERESKKGKFLVSFFLSENLRYLE